MSTHHHHTRLQLLQNIINWCYVIKVPISSRESNSTITNVCSSVHPSPKSFNSLKSSSFIIHPLSFFILYSSFIILHSSFLHFTTFKLFSLFIRSFTYLSLYQHYSDDSWHYVKDNPSMDVYFCKLSWQVVGAGAVSVSVGAKMVVDNLVDFWFLTNIHWLQSSSVSLFKRWLIQM